MSDYVPEDLLASVLLCLPLDSLLRSRCVSKSWRALIDSPNFINMHFNKYHDEKMSHDNIQIVALNRDKFCTFNLDIGGSSTANAKKLNYPVEYNSNFRVRLVGSCNGLLCIMNPNCNIVLWNPWIQKHWEFPPPQIDDSKRPNTVFFLGFGYDRVHDDYKVLNLVTVLTDFLSGEDSNSLYQDEIYLYSLKLNSWKRIKDLPFRLSLSGFGNGALVNGALHWIMEENVQNLNKYSIVAFDLSNEEFRKMRCPMIPDDCFARGLKIMNGCLCLLNYHNPSIGISLVDFWVMEHYGACESWTKLTSFRQPYGFWKFNRLTPLAYSKNSQKILLQINREKLVVHDLETKLTTDVSVSGAASCLASCVCVGSLIWPL